MNIKQAGVLAGVCLAFTLLAIAIGKLMDMSHPGNPYNFVYGVAASLFVFVVLAMIWSKVGPAIESELIRRRNSRKTDQSDQ